MFGDTLLNFFDCHAPVMRFQHVMQYFLGRLKRHRAAEQIGMGDQPVQRPFQLADIGGDLVGEEFQHARRYGDAGLGGFRLQDRDSKFIGRGMQIRHHAAAQSGSQAMFQATEVGR